MAARGTVVYAAGAVQGVVLVTAPAASTVFTSASGYHLSGAQYGALFLPQVVTAIAAALLGSRVATRRAYLGGVGCALIAMTVLAASQLVAGTATAYPILLLATAFVGAGFGLTVPAINRLTAADHPRDPDRAVLVLNALLGLGTALAPVFVAVFVGLGFWWGLPVLSGVLLAVLFAVSRSLDLTIATPAGTGPGVTGRAHVAVPAKLWLFAAFAVLYGVCETVNGNWAQVDLTTGVGASATTASVALATFWAMVTVGRLGFARLARTVAPQWIYRILPFALAVAFVLIAAVPHGRGGLGVLAFGLAGLCCSALLPLTVSFGQDSFPDLGTTVSGGLIAAYQLGFGIAAFGVGPLHSAGISLSTVYSGAAAVAVAMGIVGIVVTRTRSTVRPAAPAAEGTTP